MNIIVQKYGGSSLANSDKLKKVAKLIANIKRQGNDVVVIVSAMGKTTNKLIELAHQISSKPDKRELDMLLSTGERTTMSLLCIALNDIGIKAISLTGSQSGIITNDRHNDATVIEVRPFRVQDELAKDKVVVIGGFQGVSYKRDITTLGRGGSDTSAIAMAAALNAERCEIYSDVDGVYTSDPNIIKKAKHLPELSYQQIQEMAEAGAKVLNAQAIQFAKNKNIAIYARSTFNSKKETVIRELEGSQNSNVIGIVYEDEIVRVQAENFYSKKGLIKFFEFLKKQNIHIKEVNFNQFNKANRLSFIISTKNIHSWSDLSKKLKDNYKNILFDNSVCAVSIIGEGFSRNNDYLNETIKILNENRIEIFSIATTSFRISLIIKKVNLRKTIKILHRYWIE